MKDYEEDKRLLYELLREKVDLDSLYYACELLQTEVLEKHGAKDLGELVENEIKKNERK